MTVRLYGIRNCDKVKRALAWLGAQGIPVEFVDYRKTAPTAALLDRWLEQVDHGELVNRAGTTWRKLPDETKAAANGRRGAVALMLAQPSVIKRPVIEHRGRLIVGFDPDRYARTLHG